MAARWLYLLFSVYQDRAQTIFQQPFHGWKYCNVSLVINPIEYYYMRSYYWFVTICTCNILMIDLKSISTSNAFRCAHYNDVIMGAIASQITSLTIVFSTVYSDTDQRKHQSSASLAFVCGIHRRPVNSPHKGPVTRKMFPFDDVMMLRTLASYYLNQNQ